MTSAWQVGQYISGVVQTISNPDGTVSIVHVDPNNPVITLPDGTQAQVRPSQIEERRLRYRYFFFWECAGKQSREIFRR